MPSLLPPQATTPQISRSCHPDIEQCIWSVLPITSRQPSSAPSPLIKPRLPLPRNSRHARSRRPRPIANLTNHRRPSRDKGNRLPHPPRALLPSPFLRPPQRRLVSPPGQRTRIPHLPRQRGLVLLPPPAARTSALGREPGLHPREHKQLVHQRGIARCGARRQPRVEVHASGALEVQEGVEFGGQRRGR